MNEYADKYDKSIVIVMSIFIIVSLAAVVGLIAAKGTKCFHSYETYCEPVAVDHH